MSPATENLVLEHLRAMRGILDRHTQDLSDIKSRLGIVETQIGVLTAQYAVISNRLDRMDERVLRIEMRLELAEA
jgi:archaellum component FlaC